MSKLSRNIIAVASVLFVVAIMIVYILYRKNLVIVPEGTVGNTAGNLYSGGLFAEGNGMVFFANPYDENSLYSMNPDGTEIKKIAKLSAKYINAGGNSVFFFGERVGSSTGLGSVAGKPGIFSVKPDGTHLSQVSSNHSTGMLLVGSKIYYQHAGANSVTFDVYDLKTKKSTELLPTRIEAYSYDSDRFFFCGPSNERHVHTYNTLNEAEEVFWAGDVWNPIYYNGYIYYMDVQHNYRICRYSPVNDIIEVLANERADFFNIYEDVIYYQKGATTKPALKRMNLDGSGNVIIAEGTYENLSLTSTYAYFTEFGHTTPLYRVPLRGSGVTEFTEAREAALKELMKK